MEPVQLDRAEALDIYTALVEAEHALRESGDVNLLFDLDGAARIMFHKLFEDLLPGDEEE